MPIYRYKAVALPATDLAGTVDAATDNASTSKLLIFRSPASRPRLHNFHGEMRIGGRAEGLLFRADNTQQPKKGPRMRECV